MTGIEPTTRVSLFKQIRDLAKSGAMLDASIVTTFAFNGLYFEEVLLRSFERAGSRLNIVLVDAAQLSKALEDPLRRPQRAGSDYLLVPIRGLAAFHPKILALLSEKRSLLAVGSHNATDAGFGFNNELTALWGAGKTSPYLVREAVGYAISWLEESDALTAELLREVRDRLLVLTGQDEVPANAETFFIGSTAERSLWGQLRQYVRGEIQRVWIVGPYFDAGGQFVRELNTQLSPAEIVIAIQPWSALVPDADRFPANAKFVDISGAQAFSGYEFSESFLHGKAIVLEGPEGLVVSIGSANPTGAGWLRQDRWNAEANIVCVGELAVEAFRMLGLSDLASAPALTTDALSAIAKRTAEKRSLDAERQGEPGPPTFLGQVVEGGIKLAGAQLDAGAAQLVSSDGNEVTVMMSVTLDGVFIEVDRQRATSGVNTLLGNGKTIAHILINDAHAIRNATRSRESVRILERLGSLGTSGDFSDLFDLLGRHVMTPGEQIATGRSQARSSSESSDASSEGQPRGPRGVSLPTTEEGGSARRRISEGLIADIIAALIKSLSVASAPKSGPVDGDAPDLDEGDADEGASGESFASNLEATDVTPEVIDWPRLATACRKQVGMLLRRLEERVEHDTAEGRPANWLLGRLVIVASLLQQLRSRPPQSEIALGGRTRPASLVSVDQLKTLFHLAVRALYGSSSGLAERLEDDPDTHASQEREFLDLLLMWVAREIAADLPSPSMRRGHPIDGQVLADLAPVAMSGVSATEVPQWLAVRDPWLSIWDDAAAVDDQWLERVSIFGRRLNQKGVLEIATSSQSPGVGSMVLWGSGTEFPWPWVVTEATGKNISLVGLGGETRRVRSGFVRSLDVAKLLADEAAA
jgi:hypothetical protein